MTESVVEGMLEAAQTLRKEAGALRFGPPVTHVYNPLDYAWDAHELYVRRFAARPKRVVFLGMNPGPFGMAQTGVPFGEVEAVRDWMGICLPVNKPRPEHPNRPVRGFECPRSEVSGRRLWGLFAARFGSPAAFFADHFVVNYCPLAFLEESGRNFTPDKLPAAVQARLAGSCDQHLRRVGALLQPEWWIGVGDFAEKRLRQVFPEGTVRIGKMAHPSPASPAANRDWAGMATRQLEALGAWPAASC